MTLVGACLAAGLAPDDLIEGVYAVIAKNDAKKWETHEYRERKIRRRPPTDPSP